FNAAAEATFGYPARELIGETLDRLIPERFRTVHRGHVDAFGVTGISVRAMGGERVLAGLRRGGEEFPIEARISQVEGGGQTLYRVTLRDVRERTRAGAEGAERLAVGGGARAEAELATAAERDARQEAEAASRAKDAFLATISHELRTPLSPILTWTRLLRQPNLGADKLAQGLEVVERCARTQAQLIQHLLHPS